MAICTACGAASALGARLCAACGQPFADPGRARTGEPHGLSAIGAVDEVLPPAGARQWGGGVPYEPRGARIAGALAAWVPALRALVAPTLLLLAAAVLPALSEDGPWPPGADSGGRFRGSLALVLTVFGAPLDMHSAGDADGLALVSGVELRVVPVLLVVGWLVLLGRGLRSGRRRAAATGGRPAPAEAVRTAVVSGAVVLLLGLFGRVDLGESAARPQLGRLAVRADLPVAVAVSALLAGALALAVYGADGVRARAGRWAPVARPAARSALLAAALATVAAVVAAGLLPDAPPAWVWLPLAANGGLLLLGLGSGAGLRLGGGDGVRDVSLFQLGGAGGQWRWALLLALAGAVALGVSAYRRRLGAGDRLRLGLVYAGLLIVATLVAGLSMHYRVGLGPGPGEGYERVYAFAPSVGTVLVADLLWAAFGALALPVLFEAVRPAPDGHRAPRPAPDAPLEGAVDAAAGPPSPPLPHQAEVLDWRGRE